MGRLNELTLLLEPGVVSVYVYQSLPISPHGSRAQWHLNSCFYNHAMVSLLYSDPIVMSTQ